ncbi:hypothetical protein PENTCL1PPCAC_24509 [Pristionchus entomophagus]|uniref:Uncharacterized protein n=1 Tax=Pristionchus entomophagus TaxID=358040 RepID=A0AAV5U7G5_9BILA|nr:hypothetical protein PENTCL1PPCAC_24509 [Pristionchus entomophagus]
MDEGDEIEGTGGSSSDGEDDDSDDNFMDMRRAKTWRRKVTIARRHLRALGVRIFKKLRPELRCFSSGLALKCVRSDPFFLSDILSVLEDEKLVKIAAPSAETAPYYGACLPRDLR